MSAPRLPWERCKGESRQAYGAFHNYMMLGEKRSIPALSQYFANTTGRKKSESLLYRWSSRWLWQERCAAYDDHIRREAELSQIEKIKEMSARHIEKAMAAQSKAIRALNDLDPADLKPAEIIKWLVEGQRLERLARGEPETVRKRGNLLEILERAYTDETNSPETRDV